MKTKILTLALTGLVLLTGCRSGPKLAPDPLPFHVVMLPPSPPTVSKASPSELPGEPTELNLDLEAELLADALSEVLGEYCFVQVTRLEPEEDPGADVFERQARLLARSAELGADLLLELDLRYDEDVFRESNSSAWLNYPLFLFAGPTHWFVPDQTYSVDVDLSANFFDLEALRATESGLFEPSASVIEASARFDQVDFDFVDRADGWGDYAMGILVPSVHLARQTESTSVELHEQIVERLRTRVSQGLQSRREELVVAATVAPQFVEPNDVVIERAGANWTVRGQVHLRAGGRANRLTSVTASCADGDVQAVLGDSVTGSREGYEAIPFEVTVPDADTAHLRLRCVAGTRDRFVRTYTFPLPRP